MAQSDPVLKSDTEHPFPTTHALVFIDGVPNTSIDAEKLDDQLWYQSEKKSYRPSDILSDA